MDLLSGLNAPQQEAVTHIEGPVLVLAGAGSGKTRALTHRLAYLITEKNVSPEEILAVTFTNKAAKEMKHRMAALLNPNNQETRDKQITKSNNNKTIQQLNNDLALPWLGTFHSICVKILHREAASIGYPTNFSIYDTNDQVSVIKKIMGELDIDPKRYNPKSVLYYISSAKNEFIMPEAYGTYVNSPFEEVVNDVYVRYQKYLKSLGAMDFDDILLNCLLVFEDKEILKKYQQRFHYIMIDEYQDTNHVQYLWVKMLSAIHKNVCVVGDDSQSIYGFRGANFKNILNFEKDYPGAKIIKLEQNYRSTQNILRAADELIKFNKHKTDKTLWTESGDGAPITIYRALNERDEGEFVATQIQSLVYGGFSNKPVAKYKDVAVLYRTNAQSRAVEEAFLRFGIPYRVIGGMKFYDRREVKDIMAYLKLLVNPDDRIAFERVVNLPAKGIGIKTISKYFLEREKLDYQPVAGIANFLEFLKTAREKKDTIEVGELIDFVAEKSGYKKYILDGTAEGEGRWENVLELKSVASFSKSLETFLERVALYQDSDDFDENANVVNMMTLHSSKGLEFPYVFMVGMEEGLLPHSRSLNEESDIEEERRLCYVGITRAMIALYMIYAIERIIFGNPQINESSRFLNEIPEDVKKSI